MPHAIQRINLAGRDLTDYICKILQESKITLTTTAERESAKKIKEDLCYVSMTFADEVDNFAGKEKQFEMPGGTTMFPNMPERLQAELQGLVPEATKCKVIAPPERMISVWIGGSILASLSTFSRMWIARESNPDAQPPVVGYEEVGPRIVHQMCNS